MKKLYTTLVAVMAIVICTQTLSAQSITTDIPDILLPSPSAAQIAKYSLVGPGLSTGAANTHIPLYTYATKNLKVPIGLTYSSNGLKVDQVASRVGTGWMLNAGGVISRTIYGNPDESGTFVNPPSDFPNTTGSALTTYINSVAETGHDTQPDLFNFSFGGYSGRFIFIGSTIKKLEQNNLNIQGSITSGFTIVTPDGVKYDFHAVESSSSINSANTMFRQTLSNAWYLTQITHPDGDVIYLKYNTCQFTYLASINQSFIYSEGDDGTDGEEVAPCADNQFNQSANTITNHGVYLTEISSNSRKGGVMRFQYLTRQDIPGDYALNLITLFDATGNRLGNDTYFNSAPKKIIELGYTYPTCYFGGPASADATCTKRMFLSGLTIDDDQSYQFNYKDLNLLPQRLSYSQDDYGYYNGKTNNTLIPQPNDAQHINAFSSYGFGNRHPDWNYSQKGMLSRIVYPTGGYDSLEYEGNTVYSNGAPNCDNPDSTYRIFKDGTSTFKHNSSYYSTAFTVTCPQTIALNISCIPLTTTGGVPSYPSGEYLVTADLVNTVTGLPMGLTGQFGNALQATVGQSPNYYVSIPPGSYELKVFVEGDSRGMASFTFNNSHSVNGNKEVAGVRVKRILSYDFASDRFNIKNFTYDTLGTAHSTGLLLDKEPLYQYRYTMHHLIQGLGIMCIPKQCFYTKFSSSNYFEANATGNHIFYNKVTESQGNNFEVGGIEHTFFMGFNESSGGLVSGDPIPGAPLSNLGMYSGIEKEQKIFKMQGTQFITLKDVITNYTDDPRLYQSTAYYIIQPDPNFTANCDQVNNLHDYTWLNVGYYNLYTHWTYASSVRTITYDNNGLNPVTQIDSFIYNNPVHQLISTTQTINSKREVFTTSNLYPQDNISGLSSTAQTAQAELVSRNIIDPVLTQQVNKNGNFLSLTKLNYAIWPVNLVLPANVESQIGSAANESRVTFNRYDANGNTLEQQKTNGAKQVFLWDYTHSYPVAEAINAKFNDIAFTSFEADSTGNWNINSAIRDTTYAITGLKSYNLGNGAITKTGLDVSKNYIVSYWTKNNAPYIITGTLNGYPIGGRNYNGWTYYEHKISGQPTITLSGIGNIDELRLYPDDALMTSYTYNPIVGISSVTDAKNNIAYYEYDNDSRLINIKDQNGNIVKNYGYKFASLNVNYNAHLVYYNTAQSFNFTKNDCSSGIGTTVIETVAANLYTSIISQADADSQAIAVLDSTGQARANQDGTCIVCTGEGNQFINGACEAGSKIYTSSVRQGTHYNCTYHYLWSDGSISADYTEVSSTNCLLL